MSASGITRQNLYSNLRHKKILNLGKVKRVYFESCGLFSIYEESEKSPGLPLYPKGDKDLEQHQSETDSEKFACCNCGYVQPAKGKQRACENCGAEEWVHAIY